MMHKKLYLTFFYVFIFALGVKAQSSNADFYNPSLEQPQPFLYTINGLNPSARHWSLNYSGGYGQNAVSAIGFNGVDQNFSVKGYLGNRFTLFATVSAGFATKGGVQTLQQAEVFRDFIGGINPTGFRLGTSLGVRREFNNDAVAFSRFNAAFESSQWTLGANVRVEKAFAQGRDAVDVISSFGVHRQISGQFFGGIEAVGQDLEGLWEAEAEGGAKILIGPSLNYVPLSSNLSFSLSAGPIIYVSHSVAILNDYAYRELPASNGFTMKFNVGFRF